MKLNKIFVILAIFVSVVLLGLAFIYLFQVREYLANEYDQALSLMSQEKYDDALEIFNGLGAYKDSVEHADKIRALTGVSNCQCKCGCQEGVAYEPILFQMPRNL